MSVGRKERWALEDYLDVARLIGEGVPLNEALGKERPAKTAYWKKMQESPELQRAHELAMTMRAETRIARIEGLVDKLETGKIDPSSAATAIKALQWLSQKEDPKRYSDVQRSEITGRDGAPLIEQPRMSDFETARLLAHLLDKGTRAAVDAGDLVALPNPESAP